MILGSPFLSYATCERRADDAVRRPTLPNGPFATRSAPSDARNAPKTVVRGGVPNRKRPVWSAIFSASAGQTALFFLQAHNCCLLYWHFQGCCSTSSGIGAMPKGEHILSGRFLSVGWANRSFFFGKRTIAAVSEAIFKDVIQQGAEPALG